MSSKKETPGTSDTEVLWEVRLLESAFGTSVRGETLKIPAAKVTHDGNWVTLRDGKGRPVFVSGTVQYVRRLPGDETAEPVLANGGMSMEQIQAAVAAGTMTATGGAVPPQAKR